MIRIIVICDFAPNARIQEEISNKQFKIFNQDVVQLFSEADYSLMNFECPICSKDSAPINADLI